MSETKITAVTDTKYSKGKVAQALYVDNTENIFGFADLIFDLLMSTSQESINHVLVGSVNAVESNVGSLSLTVASLGEDLTGAKTKIDYLLGTTLFLSEKIDKIDIPTVDKGYTVEDDENLLVITEGDSAWCVQLTKLVDVNTPTISAIGGNTSNKTSSFTLTNNTSGATMYYLYTLNGTDPSDPLGEGVTTLSAGSDSSKKITISNLVFKDNNSAAGGDPSTILITVKAKAKLNGRKSGIALSSNIATRQVAARTPSLSANYTYSTNPTFTINVDTSNGEECYYTLDGTSPLASSTKYSSAVALGTVTESVNGSSKTIKILTRKSKGYANNTYSDTFTYGKCSAYAGALDTLTTVTTSNLESILSQLTKLNTLLPTSQLSLNKGILHFIVPNTYLIISLWQDGQELKNMDVNDNAFFQHNTVGNYNVYIVKEKLGEATNWVIKYKA